MYYGGLKVWATIYFYLFTFLLQAHNLKGAWELLLSFWKYSISWPGSTYMVVVIVWKFT